MKRFIRSILWAIPSVRKQRQEGTLIPPNLMVTNFLFQRILGINRSVPFSVHFTSNVQGAENLVLGERVKVSFAVSNGCNIQAMNGIEIGSDTVFASNVTMQSVNHDLYLRNILTGDGPIRIGKNCWIGANVVITAGCQIGDNVTIGAGSVVTKNLPNNSVAVGNPCRVIKTLTQEIIDDYRFRHNVVVPLEIKDSYPINL